MTNAGALRQQLQSQKNIDTFEWKHSREDTARLLLEAYRAEVDCRRRTFADDSATRESIQEFASFLSDPGGRFGCRMCGPVGNGKTTLLRAFQNALVWMDDRGFFPVRTGLVIVDAKEVADYYSDRGAYRTLRDRVLLGIDDLGKEPTEAVDYGNIRTPLIDLLEYRYSNRLLTFVTTNLTEKQTCEKYGARMADRFGEMFHKIVFKGSSYRGQ